MSDLGEVPIPCPKCGRRSEHDYKYVPRGIIGRGQDDSVHIGPCMVRTCLICDYSYEEPTKDGEGNG